MCTYILEPKAETVIHVVSPFLIPQISEEIMSVILFLSFPVHWLSSCCLRLSLDCAPHVRPIP